MTTRRYRRIATLAHGLGIRLLPTGSGSLVALHQGRQVALRNLNEAFDWLTAIAPDSAGQIETSAIRNARFDRRQRAGRRA